MKINRFDLDSYNFNNCFKFNLVMNYQRLYYKWKLFVLSNISKEPFWFEANNKPTFEIQNSTIDKKSNTYYFHQSR